MTTKTSISPVSALILLLSLGLSACAPRGTLEVAAPAPEATVRNVYVAQFRQKSGQVGNFGEPRPSELAFEKFEVSIPPTHEVGKIEWPRGTPDASKDFVTIGGRTFPDMRSFARSVAASDRSGNQETVIHVHGYNTTHAEAIYGSAQVAHDIEVPVPTVVFSWPSAAQARGYVYDRDSALISRDMLEELIIAFAEYPGRDLFLTAHSMGSYLLMETLRQIAISGRLDLSRDINGVLLLSPDIDTELFREQAERIGTLPNPFMIMVAEQDKALGLSGFLTGRGVRLGTLTDPEELSGLKVTLVDVSSLSDGSRFDHNIATTSPSAIAISKRLNEISPPGERHITEAIVKADQVDRIFAR